MHVRIGRRSSATLKTNPWSGGSLPSVSEVVYAGLRGVADSAARGVERMLGTVTAQHTAAASGRPSSVLSILNGICGDYLESTQNPLAIRMSFRSRSEELHPAPERIAAAFPDVTTKIALLVHGLCLSEASWFRQGPGIEEQLKKLGYTCIYVRYNSGRHVSTNGRELAARLEVLIDAWPAPVDSLIVLGHSMGGLVLRSACWYGQVARHSWVDRLKSVFCLGTPHHGSPLEKGGHLLNSVLEEVPYLEPLAVGRHRSAGIKDLRHGSLVDEDWIPNMEESGSRDSRQVVPLVDGVDYYFIAATLGSGRVNLQGLLLGDLFVRTGSAVGAHPNEHRTIPVNPDYCRIFERMNHFDLLSDAAVQQQITEWIERCR
jgi:pimeloyl-ACP methyl ester carboxylesterase